MLFTSNQRCNTNIIMWHSIRKFLNFIIININSYIIRMKQLKNILLPILVGLLFSCNPSSKKKATNTNPQASLLQEYLHLKNGKPIGILRLECADCSLIYSVDKRDSAIHVKNGNEDRFIFPENNTYVKTRVVSNKDQMIRILVINPNGEIVSNVLDSFINEEQRNRKFLMSYHGKDKNTTVINSM